MIFSNESLFSDRQAITATARSTEVYDLKETGTPYRGNQLNADVGAGTLVPLTVQVVEGFDNLTSLAVSVEVGATEALGESVFTETILLADLVVGKQLNVKNLPHGLTSRYLGLRYTVVGTAPTAGRITAGLSMGSQTNTTGA